MNDKVAWMKTVTHVQTVGFGLMFYSVTYYPKSCIAMKLHVMYSQQTTAPSQLQPQPQDFETKTFW